MKIFYYSTLVALLLPIILIILIRILSSRSTIDREKKSPFECGFDPKNTARIPFSLRFFLLAVIFLVFDIEIVLLIPIPWAIHLNLMAEAVAAGTVFLIILIVGLLHEWREGSLDWGQ